VIHALLPSDSRVPNVFHRYHVTASPTPDVLILLPSLPLCVQRSTGATALWIAAEKGHVECFRELLSPHQHAVTGAQVLMFVIGAILRKQMFGKVDFEHSADGHI